MVWNSILEYIILKLWDFWNPNKMKLMKMLSLKELNSLEQLAYKIIKEDIDISRPTLTQRIDGKRLSVCNFISRKMKEDFWMLKVKGF